MSDAQAHCSLCGDEALPAVVLALHADATADVESECATQRVALDLVDGVQVGDTILVHQGFAITRVETP